MVDTVRPPTLAALVRTSGVLVMITGNQLLLGKLHQSSIILAFLTPQEMLRLHVGDSTKCPATAALALVLDIVDRSFRSPIHIWIFSENLLRGGKGLLSKRAWLVLMLELCPQASLGKVLPALIAEGVFVELGHGIGLLMVFDAGNILFPAFLSLLLSSVVVVELAVFLLKGCKVL